MIMSRPFEFGETSGLVKGNFVSRCSRKLDLKEVVVAHFGFDAYVAMLATLQPLCISQIEGGVLFVDFYLSDYLFSNIPLSNTAPQYPSTYQFAIQRRKKADLEGLLLATYGVETTTKYLLVSPNPLLIPTIRNGAICLNFFL